MTPSQLDKIAQMLKEGKQVFFIRARRTKWFQLEMEKRGVVFPKPIKTKVALTKPIDEIMWEQGRAQREAEAKQLDKFFKKTIKP
jgi:hypothetical protein